MIKYLAGFGVLCECLASGMVYAGSHHTSWIPFAAGAVAAIPKLGAWATAFAHGGLATGPTLWHLQHAEALDRLQIF